MAGADKLRKSFRGLVTAQMFGTMLPDRGQEAMVANLLEKSRIRLGNFSLTDYADP